MSTKSPELRDLRVYVSSTSDDLEEYRVAVIAALRKMKTIKPVGMEDYVSGGRPPIKKCLDDVSKCDIYVGIFAWRYGSIPRGYKKSFTELEYSKAVGVGIPPLIFLLNEKFDWLHKHYGNEKDQLRINALRKKLKRVGDVTFFTDPQDLAIKVLAAVSIKQREIDKDRMAKIQSEQYAQVGTANSPEQKASIQQAITLEQEAMRQQSLKTQQVKREPIPIQLPKLRGLFVDREIEQDILFQYLRKADNRLVVIIAPGGYGKTELATKVLKDIAPGTSIVANDVHGILYMRCAKGDINLGKIFDGAGKIAGKADEFLKVYTSKEMTLARKLEFFFNELTKVGNVWLVMDNFEDLLDTNDDSIKDDELREFLETAVAIKHNVRLIVTSRAVPKFKGSRKIEKIDLSSGLPEEQAIRYLREEGTEYGLGNEDENVLRTFVSRVHYIPMALVSVLGYLHEHHAITLGELLADDSLFLDFDRHDIKEGLKNLVLQQIKSISPDAQLALSVLSIFSKPTSFPTLHYLLQGIEKGEFDAILTCLEKNRLIIHNNGYYDMHPVVRSLAYERIPESEPSGNGKDSGKDGEAAVLTRCGLHKKAAEFFEKLRKPEKDWRTIADLEPQLEEIHHLMRAGQYDEAARVLGIIDFDYLQLWGYAGIVIELREQFIRKLKDTYLASVNAGYLGTAYRRIGRVLESLSYLEQAIQGAKDNNDKGGIGAWLGSLALAHWYLGEIREAFEYCEQALTIDREIGYRRGEGVWLGNLGDACFIEGDFNKAVEHFLQALEIAKNIENSILTSDVLIPLAYAFHYHSKLPDAEKHYRESLKFDVPLNICQSAVLLGILLLEKGESAKAEVSTEAEDFIKRGISLCRQILEKTPDLFKQLYKLALALLASGDSQASLETYRKAITTCSAKGVVKRALMDLSLLERAAPNIEGLAGARKLLTRALDG
ncbi:MAG: tetratricopeptide repeat protein [Nitrospirae bacterium]|nr:tetratricopeptide repeat protein [Nitrospirota bacterium]